MNTVLLKNGKVIDGTGAPGYIADVLVVNGYIKDIGRFGDVQADETIDASGLIVCPGFIDTHTHNELDLLYNRQHANGLSQGVTTELIGNCGGSYAPMPLVWVKDYIKMIAGSRGNPPGIYPDWETVSEFLSRYDKACGINVAYTTGHSPIRLGAVGFLDVPLKGYPLEKAKKALAGAMEDGAVGFNTGLTYYPQSYSDTDELVELCKVVAKYGGVFSIHIRTEFRGEPYDPEMEALEIAGRSGVKLHINHIKTSQKTAGKIDELMKTYSKADKMGVDISFELYPYHSGSGSLLSFIPGWALEGGYEATIERLSDKATREKIAIDTNRIYSYIFPENNAVITNVKNQPQYTGVWLKDIAKEKGVTLAEAIHLLLLDNDLEVGMRGQPLVNEEMSHQLDRDILELLKMPNYMVGSDSTPAGEKPHPRVFGTFAKLLRMAREHNFPLETMINRITMTPAERFRLPDRGRISKGMAADIVVFDPEKVTDTATWECPRSMAVGIEYVLVNGKVALRNGKVTGLFAGRALKRR
jgi:N-acyl-D-amino-acid deacylase